MTGGAVAYLVANLAFIDRKLSMGGMGKTPEDAALEFLQNALSLATVDDVAKAFATAVTQALGDQSRALILAPRSGEGVRVLSRAGEHPELEEALGDPTPAFLWLGDRHEPLRRSELAELSAFEGAASALAMVDALGCDILLPLRHRGLLLGLGLVKLGARAETPAVSAFFKAMRAYTTVAVANTFLNAEAGQKSALSKTFDLATAVQTSLVPDERPVRRQRFELKGIFRPVAECGGDLWAWRELADGKVLLLIADATGHGAAPALLAAAVKGAIDAQWQISIRDMDPATLLSALNRSVFRTGRKRYMMTAFAAVIDTRKQQMHFANAGQNFPYMITANGVGALIARGNSLGAVPEATYETHVRDLAIGDRLIMYTDGITEAGSPYKEPWGEKRLRAALAAMSNERATRIPELLLAEVEQFLGDTENEDDITLLAFELVLEEAFV